MFRLQGDRFELPYFSYDFDESAILNISLIPKEDVAHFLIPMLNIKKRFGGPFSSDLTTQRDDIVLAFLSLVLLLIIDGFVTTILLRTKEGNISNFGFSVKQIVELIRDFNFRRIFKPWRRRSAAHRQKINSKLIVLAVTILLFTFALEMAVLILTEPKPKEVFNSRATLRLLQPVAPKWNAVYFHTRASMNRPCQAVTFQNVSQAETRINVCVSANMSETSLQLFKRIEDDAGDVDAEIVSYMHDYGAEHSVRIGDDSATYSTRAYFTLGDKESRLMRVDKNQMLTGIDTVPRNETEGVQVVHGLLIAYLFSAYQRAVNDSRVTEDTLNSLKDLNFTATDGGMVDVLSFRDKKFSSPARKYTTTLSGFLPRGSAALRVAQHVFAGSTAIVIAYPDMEDLFMEKGMDTAEAVVWMEDVRAVNWLSLCLIVTSSLFILLLLRKLMKPVATAEIAGVFVKSAVGASISRSPMEIDEEETTYFRISKDDEEGNYVYGAETADGWSTISNEYGDENVY